jgi:hypothetical protein
MRISSLMTVYAVRKKLFVRIFTVLGTVLMAVGAQADAQKPISSSSWETTLACGTSVPTAVA